jgi:hypothetical protein
VSALVVAPRARVVLASAVAVAAWVALAVLGWPASTYRDFDFIGFWAGGRAVVEGLDPYDPAVWSALFAREGSKGWSLVAGSGLVYPFTTAVLVLPFAALPLGLAAPAWLVVQVVAALSAVTAFGRRVLPSTWRPDAPLLLGFVATSQAAVITFTFGNAGGFVVASVAGALLALLAGRPFLAGAALGLLALKPHLVLWAVPLLLVYSTRRWRILAGGTAVGGALLIVSLLIRPDWPLAWTASAGRLNAMNVARANAWGMAPPDARWLGWIPMAIALAAFVVWWRRRRPDLPAFWGGALALSLFGAPHVWSYDGLVLAVPATAALAGAARAGRRERLALIAALGAAIVLVPWALYLRAWRTGDEPWSGVVPLAMLGVLMWATRRR